MVVAALIVAVGQLFEHVVIRAFENRDAAVRVNSAVQAANRADAGGNRHVDLVGYGIGSDGMGIAAGDGLVCRYNVRIRLDFAAGLVVVSETGRVGRDGAQSVGCG